MLKRLAFAAALGIATLGIVTVGTVTGAAAQQRALCYNCPPEWADWGSQLKAIQAKLGIQVPPDNKNSGQAIAALIAEKANPVADVTYLGGIAADPAKDAGVLTPYKPKNWEKIPADLKDADGNWFTIHSGTLGLFVNKAALGNKPVPQSWADLLKPEYKGLVGYLDPTSAAVGQLGVMAINLALGGTYDNLDPAIKFFKELAKNQPIVPKQTSYARVISGEIPILLDYDFNAYRGQYTDKAPVQFVIPKEGTLVFPYVMGLVNKGPNPDNGKKVLDFVLSDESQAMWGNAYLRPVFADKLSAEAKAKFLPDAEYARAKAVDLKALAKAQPQIVERYRKEVN
ncbi:MAG: extracellular solute-binding protein [Reyranella sp.]|jgi:putative spermidine/putrescine transport system substrate-binding protein|uniref:extracellular solute-binding protein n=1 Tax=Reyranella sp. TaxID=1929291 RepID=UPI00095A183B|nr:extracellular solute-binding protein [Reyranella sp.]MBN9538548.1 extracellular solute-binding protein [Alphaproteobacteria bacterium]MBR2817382.1 extracellular solute-binding protein [Reyranella sp.]OJU33807.1 MAG: ABC transporter substrate-binding protein [Alphaproteobacteria bacterium 65-37]